MPAALARAFGFRPTLVEGCGHQAVARTCKRDLVASFFSVTGLFVNPLGERGRSVFHADARFSVDDPMVLARRYRRLQSRQSLFPVLQWIEDNGGLQLSTVEYRGLLLHRRSCWGRSAAASSRWQKKRAALLPIP